MRLLILWVVGLATATLVWPSAHVATAADLTSSGAAALLEPHADNSPGCAPPRPHAAGSINQTIVTADGLTRDYILHVLPSYTGADPTALVLNFHGLGSSAAAQQAYSGMSLTADQPGGGFIVVYPQGINQRWNNVQAPSPDVDDVAFTDQLLASLDSQLCIATERTYSTGMSNGALMSVRLACSLSIRIAAVAPVAGAYYPPLFRDVYTEEDCPDTRPVPLIAFHGTSDMVIPFNGGPSPAFGGIWFRLPIDNTTPDEDVTSDWAAHNGCTGGRQEEQVAGQVRLVSYQDCQLGATVELYAIDGGGHVWPSVVNTNDLIWEFFQAHTLLTVGGSAELPQVARPRVESSGPPGTSVGFLSGVVAAAALGTVALSGAAWYARRRGSEG